LAHFKRIDLAGRRGCPPDCPAPLVVADPDCDGLPRGRADYGVCGKVVAGGRSRRLREVSRLEVGIGMLQRLEDGFTLHLLGLGHGAQDAVERA